MTKLHSCVATLAFFVTTAGVAWAQPARPAAPQAPAATIVDRPALEAARADMERALLAAEASLGGMSGATLEAMSRYESEGRLVAPGVARVTTVRKP